MIQAPEISVVAYHKGLKKVKTRTEADTVTIQANNDKTVNYAVISKANYNGSQSEVKPCKSWNELPENI